MIDSQENKKSITIATHSGAFHADDVFAVATLTLLLEKKYGGAENVDIKVVRSRDMEKIKVADYVVDVGNIYDPAMQRFDHHQAGRAGARDNGIPYAAFGLVWKEYGEKVAGSLEIAEYIDKKLVTSIDAVDNGVEIVDPRFPNIYPYRVDDVIHAYTTTSTENGLELDTRFTYLVDFAEKLIVREILKIKDKIEGSVAVQEIYDKNKDKRLLILDKQYSMSISRISIPDALLLISPDGLTHNWAIKVVRQKEHSFESEIYFPKSWGGKRDEELEKITGVKGAIFCHTDCWFAVAATKEAAIEMAEIALREAGIAPQALNV